ncbi:DNA polymerase III PolC-type [Andreesenia angusta]|uniref:DNA polymerase III PolC-type n=2 Tax=Andreesenia angusta TaxID=39480 RepID=A0A1S1V898_9FIRM|nr:DNA polymerase III PolC-type [Andreesenia angusta]
MHSFVIKYSWVIYMYKADLHIHTTSSDGLLSPSEVVDWAVRKGINAVAVTDHDTVDGIEEALRAGEEAGIEVIPGIELSCTYRGEEIHVLGYFIDWENGPLVEKLKELKEARDSRGHKMVEKLIEYGLDITVEAVMEKVGEGSFGRPHIARTMVDRGIVGSVEDAFNFYLVKGKPGYVERYKLTVEEGISLIKSANGVAVMAHPGIVSKKGYPKEILRYGFDGIEVVHSSHSEDTVDEYEKLALKMKLIATGGSDCHGVMKGGIPMIGDYTASIEAVERLKEARAKREMEANANG